MSGQCEELCLIRGSENFLGILLDTIVLHNGVSAAVDCSAAKSTTAGAI